MAQIINNQFPYSNINNITGIENGPAATVTVGTVSPDDNDADYADLGSDFDIFTDYEINSRYESDKHRYMAGITSPGGFQSNSVAFFQLASPTLLWIVDWTAAKFNSQPEIPAPLISPGFGGINWILMDEHYEPAKIAVASDGVTPIYRISGTYVYGHQNPDPQVLKNVAFGRPPWLEDVFDRTMPTSKWTQNLSTAQGVN